MRVLVCALTGQPIPNLLSVHHYRPDHLVLLQTEQMASRLKPFLQALALRGAVYQQRRNCSAWKLTSPQSVRQTAAELEPLLQRFPDAEWIVNLAGGTKPMNIAAWEVFGAASARRVYVEESKPDTFIDLDTDQPEHCCHRPTVREFLVAYGKDFRTPDQDRSAWEDHPEWDAWWECARGIAEVCPGEALTRQQSQERGDPRVWGCGDGTLTACVNAAFGTALTPGAALDALEAPVAGFVNGGWLELFLAGLLHRHRVALGVWDVRVSVKVRSLEDEMDVVFLRRHALHSIECKSGAQAGDEAGLSEALRKVETKIRSLRALRVRSHLALCARQAVQGGKLESSLRARAEAYECRVLTYPDLQRLAQEHSDPVVVRSVLFEDGALAQKGRRGA